MGLGLLMLADIARLNRLVDDFGEDAGFHAAERDRMR
jgi:hypothetical protein